MSVTLEKLTPVSVYDPRTVYPENVFPVVKGGSNLDYRQITTNNVSSSSISFSVQSPGYNLYLDRRMQLTLPVRCTFTATGLDAGVFLLNPNQCCVRSWPLQKCIESLSITINNQNVSIVPSDIMSCIEHFNLREDLLNVDMSKTPTYGAQSQDFSDLFGSNRSQMALYADGQDISNIGFPFTIVSQTNDAAGPGASTAISVVDILVTEPLFLSPLYWGAISGSDMALRGVQSMDVTMNFSSGAANRIMAIDNVSVGVAFAPATWSSSVQFNNFSPTFSYSSNQPLLQLCYITPQLTDQSSDMNRVLSYPYWSVDRSPTDLPAIAPGASTTVTNNQVQLNTIPTKIYLFIRDRNADLQANPFTPDTFCAINQVQVQWGTMGTKLGSASQQQLFDLAVKNGFVGNYASWSGTKLNKNALASANFGKAAEQYSGLGSIICLTPDDLGLGPLEAAGKLEQFSVQFTVNYTNVSSRTINPTLYLVTVSSGVFSLLNGQGYLQVGVLTSDMILNSQKQTGRILTLKQVNRIYGGNFFDSLKSGLSDVWSFLKPIAKIAAPIASAVFPEAAPIISGVSSALGGAKLSRAQLRDRLRQQ